MISKNWREKAKIYKIFAPKDSDLSKKSAKEMYLFETFGKGDLGGIFSAHNNGYYLGKKWMDVTLKLWAEGIRDGLTIKDELYQDGKFPKEWLDKVLKNMHPSDEGIRVLNMRYR